jgi:hypothetical protein
MPDPVQAPEPEVECPTPLAAIGAKQQRALVQNTAIPRGAPFHADGLNMTVVMVDLDAPSGGHYVFYEQKSGVSKRFALIG